MQPNTGRTVVTGDLEEFENALSDVLIHCSPGSMVSIGGSASRLVEDWLHHHGKDLPHSRYPCLEDWAGSDKTRESAQVVFLKFDPMAASELERREISSQNLQLSYLGALCRQYPFGVIIVQPNTTSELRQKFFAAGFMEAVHWVDSADENRQPTAVYVYRLSNYKSAPSWLNAKYWANPERYDLPPE